MKSLRTSSLQVAALKAELADLRAVKSVSFSMPTTGDVLSSLGLDTWKDDRLKGQHGAPKVRTGVHLTQKRYPFQIQGYPFCISQSVMMLVSSWRTPYTLYPASELRN